MAYTVKGSQNIVTLYTPGEDHCNRFIRISPKGQNLILDEAQFISVLHFISF